MRYCRTKLIVLSDNGTTEDTMTVLSPCCNSKFKKQAPKLYRCRACSILWALAKFEGKLGLTRATYYHTGVKG